MRIALRALAAAATAALAAAGPAAADAGPLTLGVIGDAPYGAAQLTQLPALVQDVNDDRDVSAVLHLGDIKNGSSVCSDEYFATVRAAFDTFDAPLVYTPGDNEWTDCHRANNGGYLPTERLEAVRRTFFPVAGRTLGATPARVDSQAFDRPHSIYRENVLWDEDGVVLSTVHVVGSNNDRQPWFGEAESSLQRALREREYAERRDADLAWLDRTFAMARREGARAVVIAMQADMWDAFSVANGLPLDGFDPIVRRLAQRARAYGKPVLLLQGDSHGFLVDHPLAEGSPVHGVTAEAPNVTRVVVQGAQTTEWLRVTVDADGPRTFSFTRVPVS